MSELRKMTQTELSEALGISESEVSRYIADNEPKSDGSGHWVFFSIHTPEEVLFRFGVGAGYRLELDR